MQELYWVDRPKQVEKRERPIRPWGNDIDFDLPKGIEYDLDELKKGKEDILLHFEDNTEAGSTFVLLCFILPLLI